MRGALNAEEARAFRVVAEGRCMAGKKDSSLLENVGGGDAAQRDAAFGDDGLTGEAAGGFLIGAGEDGRVRRGVEADGEAAGDGIAHAVLRMEDMAEGVTAVKRVEHERRGTAGGHRLTNAELPFQRPEKMVGFRQVRRTRRARGKLEVGEHVLVVHVGGIGDALRGGHLAAQRGRKMGGAKIPRQVKGDRLEAQTRATPIAALLDAVEVGKAGFINNQHLGGGDVRRGGLGLHQNGAGHQSRLPGGVHVNENLQR